MRKHFKGLFQAFMIALMIYLSVACILCVGILYLWETAVEGQNNTCLTLAASPLPDEVVDDLCERSIMPETLDACSRESALYPQDVHTIVTSNIHIDKSTYQQVESAFGGYQTLCREQNLVSSTQLRCHYLLGINQFYVSFDRQNEVAQDLRFVSCSLGS